jgi:hypothetical protein
MEYIDKEIIVNLGKEMSVFLHKYSFALSKQDISKYSFRYTYRNKDMYILLKGSFLPYDYPPYLNIIAGKGEDVFPECDINSAPLWMIIRYLTNSHYAKEYDLNLISKSDFFERIKSDMKCYLQSFLNGDFEMIEKARKWYANELDLDNIGDK